MAAAVAALAEQRVAACQKLEVRLRRKRLLADDEELVVRKKPARVEPGERLMVTGDLFRMILALLCLDLPAALAKQRVCQTWRAYIRAQVRKQYQGHTVYDLKITACARHLHDLMVEASYGHVPTLEEIRLGRIDTAQSKQLLYVYARFKLWSQLGYYCEERVGSNDDALQRMALGLLYRRGAMAPFIRLLDGVSFEVLQSMHHHMRYDNSKKREMSVKFRAIYDMRKQMRAPSRIDLSDFDI
jgi:hypothetical protein